MIKHPCSPRCFNSRPDRRNSATRFARNQDRSNRPGRHINPFVGGDLGQAKGVCRGTAQHRDLIVLDQLKSRFTAHPAGRQAQVPLPQRAFKSSPESQERTERKREAKAIIGTQTHQPINDRPAVQQPVPTGRGIQPPKRLAGRRPRCLVQPRVLRGGISQISSVGGK